MEFSCFEVVDGQDGFGSFELGVGAPIFRPKAFAEEEDLGAVIGPLFGVKIEVSSFFPWVAGGYYFVASVDGVDEVIGWYLVALLVIPVTFGEYPSAVPGPVDFLDVKLFFGDRG